MASKNGSGYNRGYADYMNRWKAPLVTRASNGTLVFTREIATKMAHEDLHFFALEYIRGQENAAEDSVRVYSNVG